MSYDRDYFIRVLRDQYHAGELSADQIRRLERIGFPFAKRGAKRTPKNVICLETGHRYESESSAARELGIARDKIRAAIRNGYAVKGRHFYHADEPKPRDDFFKPYYGRHDLVVCIETGERFKTLNAAALSVGLKAGHSIRLAINTGGSAGGYHWQFDNDERGSCRFKKPFLRGVAIRCVETGKVYKSLARAAEDADCDPSLIRDAIRRKGTCRGRHWEYFDKDSISNADMFPSDPRLRPVRCAETREIFPSIKAAAASVGVRSPNISAVLAGKQKSAGGYHWKYVDDENGQSCP